jgi:NTP pyrophosphohydrolases including oxidative damage repair enzymes
MKEKLTIFDVTETTNAFGEPRDLVHMHNNAVLVMVHDVKSDKFLVTEEYRTGVGGTSYGFVSGKVEAGETEVEAMIREVIEEAGIRIVRARSFMTPTPLYTSEGFTDERMTVGVFDVQEYVGFKTNQDADEHVSSFWVSREELNALFEQSKITALPAWFANALYLVKFGG